MTDRDERLGSAIRALPVPEHEPHFWSEFERMLDDGTPRVGAHRLALRLAAAAVVIALVGLGIGVTAGRRSTPSTTGVSAGGEPGTIDEPPLGRWQLSQMSKVQAGSPAQPVLTFNADGTLDGLSGCGRVVGSWKRKADRLEVFDLAITSGSCDAAAGSIVELLQRVLRAKPTIGEVDDRDGTLKLTAENGDFVGFERDRTRGTAWDPEISGEVMRLPVPYVLATDASAFAPGAAPRELRTQAWWTSSNELIVIRRLVGGPRFSARAVTLLRQPASMQQVRGHAGAVQSVARRSSLTWEEAPGVTLTIDAPGTVDVAELADALAYDRGRLTSADGAPQPGLGRTEESASDFRVAAEGVVQDVPWQLQVYRTGHGVCLDVAVALGSAGSCDEEAMVVRAAAYDFFGDRVLAGSAIAIARTVRVEFADGSAPLVIETAPLDGYDARYFASTLRGTAPIARVIAVNGEGTDIGVITDVGGGGIG